MTTSSRTERIFAWSVHAFTMTGVVWACLASLALANNEPKQMWLWLVIALVVDGLDGTFARKARVSKVIPWFDGVILDDIVDYLTWTFIPAIFMYRYLPLGPKPVAMAMLILICTSSMFCYCNKGMKSQDFYFVGFPAAWNIVAAHMVILQTPAWFNIIIVLIFASITVAPITFTHPFRVRRFMTLNIIAATAWVGSSIILVALSPSWPLWAVIPWIGGGGWLTATSIWRTIQGRPDEEEIPAT